MSDSCPKCGGAMEAGVTRAPGLIGSAAADIEKPQLVFVALGTPTSVNPVKAFQQGLHGEPGSRAYLIRGSRCSACGFLEFYATEPT
jgi:predicted nucleic-acid-binding Zn-ribbon protein